MVINYCVIKSLIIELLNEALIELIFNDRLTSIPLGGFKWAFISLQTDNDHNV
jgi:hypothetical protein